MQQALQQALNKVLPGNVKYLAARGKNWIVPAAMWGGFFGGLGLFLTEWKVVTTNLPIYKGKYDHKPPQ